MLGQFRGAVGGKLVAYGPPPAAWASRALGFAAIDAEFADGGVDAALGLPASVIGCQVARAAPVAMMAAAFT